MSHDDALSALSEAAAQDAAAEQVEAAPPASPTAPEQGAPVEANVQPEGQAPVVPPVDPAGEGQPAPEPVVPFNPDELPEELLPAWRQMQAAFTPRLQQAAAITKRFEELGGEEAVQQAMSLYERVGNPEHWPTLYEELYQAMEQAGFEFEDPASAPATVASSPFSQLATDDPDLAPLISEMQALRGRTDEQQTLIEQFYQEQELRQQMADEELRQAQHLANLQRQVMTIRQANPTYNDEDVKAIIELGSFYGDDLPLAQQRYEAIIASRLNRYFESKKGATPPSTQPVPGAGVLSTTDDRPATLEDAEAEAVELMRRLQAAGEFDFS
jgi:hypothetical protein